VIDRGGLDDDDRAALHAELEASIAEADAGHGVFAAAHELRCHVIPTPPTDADPDADADADPPMSVLARRLAWASLLERVFGSEATQCPRCGDRLRVLAFITDPDATLRILTHLGLATEARPATIAPARAPPTTWFDDVE
jgi:hypothetical protein